MKPKHQTILLVIFAALTSVLISIPSYAITLEEFLSLVTQFTNAWEDISEDAQQAVDNSTGDMGEADPITAGNDLRDRISDEYTLPVAQEKAQDLERALTRASIQATLGEAGQTDSANKIVVTREIAQAAESLAQQAQEMDASQNILKVIAAQNAQIVGMLAEQRNDSISTRSDTTQSNLMLTQIAENMANESKKENMQRMGAISLNHELVGMSRLDPSYVEP